MSKIVVSLVATSLVTWAASATAQDTTDSPVVPPSSSTSPAAGSSAPSDLPAPESRSLINRPLLVTSAILLVGSYATVATDAFVSHRPEDQNNLYYPVAGPWMDLANRDCTGRPCNLEGLNKTLLIADGIGQGLGAIGVVASFFLPGKTTRHWYLIGDDGVHAGPTRVGIGGYGFGAAGKF